MITRFAPSPTGPLHLGHAYSAMLAHDMAMAHGGTFFLRIEDIDHTRCRPAWEAQIYDDLRWLGLTWPDPVMRQSDRAAVHAAAADRLWQARLAYDCTCTRTDIAAALSAPQEGASPATGQDGPIYPGTCRNRARTPQATGPNPAAALRLDMARAVTTALRQSGGDTFGFLETGHGPQGETGHISFTPTEAVTTIGDVVVARRGLGTSYHLSVVLDDAAQGVTHVVRGTDLFDATRIHVILQALFDLPTPIYHHHRLIRDDQGRRLAKRDDARALSLYRAEGATPADIRALIGL